MKCECLHKYFWKFQFYKIGGSPKFITILQGGGDPKIVLRNIWTAHKRNVNEHLRPLHVLAFEPLHSNQNYFGFSSTQKVLKRCKRWSHCPTAPFDLGKVCNCNFPVNESSWKFQWSESFPRNVRLEHGTILRLSGPDHHCLQWATPPLLSESS